MFHDSGTTGSLKCVEITQLTMSDFNNLFCFGAAGFASPQKRETLFKNKFRQS